MRSPLPHRLFLHAFPATATALLLFVLAAASAASAQSTDPQSPTPLASGEIQGAGVEQKTVYYYTFEGGPGAVSATLEAKTKKGAKGASVGIELLDAHAKSIASTLLNEGLGGGKEQLGQLLDNGLGRITSGIGSLTGDTRQKTSRVKLKERQALTLRVTVGTGIENYTVKIEGAVEFGGAMPVADPAQTNGTPTETPAPATEQPATAEQPVAQPEQAAPTDAAAPPAQAAPASNQAPAVNKRPAIVKIPGRNNQASPRPAIVKIPGKKPPQP